MNYLWITLALISTIYSALWDIRYDFGFLEDGPNYPLRNKLIYDYSFAYYAVAVLNFIFRFLWLVTLSPEIMDSFIRPELSALIIYACEITRRGMWNFIRVEYKYIEICNKFLVTADTPLPFVKNAEGQFELRDSNVAGVINISQNQKFDRRLSELKLKVNKSKHIIFNIINFQAKIEKDGKYESKEFRNDFRKYIHNVAEDTYRRISEVNRRVSILEVQKASIMTSLPAIHMPNKGNQSTSASNLTETKNNINENKDESNYKNKKDTKVENKSNAKFHTNLVDDEDDD